MSIRTLHSAVFPVALFLILIGATQTISFVDGDASRASDGRSSGDAPSRTRPAPALSTESCELAKLTAPDGAAYDWFGRTVAMHDDTIIVGSHLHDANGPNSGSAYVFRHHEQAWEEQQELVPSDPLFYEHFGQSVAITRHRVIVGSRRETKGAVYVFLNIGDSWTEEAILVASDGQNFDGFALSVAAGEDLVVVGAHRTDDIAEDSGSAYVFRRDGGTWLQEQELFASDGSANNSFGRSVAIVGEVIVVGAAHLNECDEGSDAGEVYVFHYEGGSWAEQQKLTASDGGPNDNFGISLAASEDTILIGSHLKDEGDEQDTGAVYVFRKHGAGWIEEQKLIASDAATGDEFGISVSVNQDLAVIGAYRDDDAGSVSGSAYVFRYDGSGWIEAQKLTASDAAQGDNFGRSVSTSRDFAVVGAFADDDLATNSGAAYVFAIAGDCNDNGIFDACDIADGTSADENGNGVPDECDECLDDSMCDNGEVCVSGECVLDPVCVDGDGDGRVTICHAPPGNPGNARTIEISVNAIDAHLTHGDSCGPCD